MEGLLSKEDLWKILLYYYYIKDLWKGSIYEKPVEGIAFIEDLWKYPIQRRPVDTTLAIEGYSVEGLLSMEDL